MAPWGYLRRNKPNKQTERQNKINLKKSTKGKICDVTKMFLESESRARLRLAGAFVTYIPAGLVCAALAPFFAQ